MIAAVHRRSALLAGADLIGVLGLAPGALGRGRAGVGAGECLRRHRGAGRRATPTSSTSAAPTRPTRRTSRPWSPPASTSSARSPSPSRSRTPCGCRPWPTAPASSPRCRSSTATTPSSARSGPGCRPGTSAAGTSCTGSTCRTGCSPRGPRTGGSTPCSVGSRARSPTSAPTGATWSSGSAASGSTASSRSCPSRWPSGSRTAARRSARRATARRCRSRPRTPRPSSSGPSTAVPGSLVVSQVAAGRKNRLWFELDGSDGSAVFDQEQPEAFWLGTSDGGRTVVRDPASGSAEQRRLSYLPAGHAQGYGDCFAAYRLGHLRRDPRRGAPRGCRPSPTAYGRPASSRPWFGPRAPRPGRRSPHEARDAHGLSARLAPGPDRRVGGAAPATKPSKSRCGHRPGAATSRLRHLPVADFGAQQRDETLRAVRQARPGAVGASPTTRTTCTPTRARREEIADAPAARDRRRQLVGCGLRRHLRRARPLAQRRRQHARGRAGLPAARRVRRRAGREADHRELRDGGLAPGRLPRQHRLLPRALGVDVLARTSTSTGTPRT